MTADTADTTVPATTGTAADTLLSVEGLTLDLVAGTRQPGLVADVSFTVRRGASVALVGESGCGKTLTSMAVMGLLPPAIRVAGGHVWFNGVDLLACGEAAMRSIRGGPIGMVFQNPMSTLDPTMRVGDQIAESRRIHLGESRKVALGHAERLLDRVGIADARRRLRAYPHEMSGGMQQRVGIAAAIACDPELILADEPTTALDVTVQAEILELLRELQADTDMAVLLVSHDLGVVADFCDEVVIMYAGSVVERAPIDRVFGAPQHPYAQALLEAAPQQGTPRTFLPTIGGRVPPAGSFPDGCRFQPRCAHAVPDRCDQPQPLGLVAAGHHSACGRVLDGALDLASSPVAAPAAAPPADDTVDRP